MANDLGIPIRELMPEIPESNRYLVGLIADYDTTIGFLLAGIGEYIDANKTQRNFLLVTDETPLATTEAFFRLLRDSKKVGLILIGKEIYDTLPPVLRGREADHHIPIVIPIPSRKTLSAVTKRKLYLFD